MILYTDAGMTYRFKYFIYSNQLGKVFGSKLMVRKPSDTVPPEFDAIVAAIYWLKCIPGEHTIFTDYLMAPKILSQHKVKSRLKYVKYYHMLLKNLLIDNKIKLLWVPRSKNVAGKLLERMPKGKNSGEADKVLKKLLEFKRVS